jgi:bisphosphoglycerate-dependent phosphoglycerate mutase
MTPAKIEQDYETHIQFQADDQVEAKALQQAVSRALPKFDEEITRQLRQDRQVNAQVHSSAKLRQP